MEIPEWFILLKEYLDDTCTENGTSDGTFSEPLSDIDKGEL